MKVDRFLLLTIITSVVTEAAIIRALSALLPNAPPLVFGLMDVMLMFVLVGVAWALTKRLQNRSDELQQRDASYRAIFEESVVGMFQSTPDGLYLRVNPAYAEMLKYQSPEHMVASINNVAHQVFADPDRRKEFTLVLRDHGLINRFEFEAIRNDGCKVWLRANARAIYDPHGVLLHYLGAAEDITASRLLEEALRRSEERFRLVARATKDVIWDLDVRCGKIWRSETFWQYFGYPPRDTETDVSGWKELLHPEDRGRVWNGFQTALARHADSYEVEYRFRRADGSYAVVLDRAYIVYDGTGQPTRAIGAITDLSDRRDLEEQFRQAQKMEAVGRLAGGVAHDFNNLLMVITAYSEMMRDKLNPKDELQKSIAQVNTAADRAAGLTRQLLAFSRKQVLLPRIIDLSSVVEDTSKMIKRLLGEDIELNVSLGTALWAVKADPGQIVQVLMNLCVNARDAMPNGGKLTIATENCSFDVKAAKQHRGFVPGKYAALVVRDTGTGMTREVQSHLFEPFFTTKESGRGTGLGLSTVFGIVKQSGGYIWVDSELGRGSSFTIYFPAVDAPLTTTSTPEIIEANGQGEVILLVEDDEALRESISTYLGLHGYKVLEASDGVQALDIASQHAESIQVLITDMILPKLRGAELAREVAKMSPHAVILYVSGYTDRELTDYDPTSSTVGFLQKPFALQTLLQKIREMIMAREWPEPDSLAEGI